jgi:hypothetical protein
MSEPEKNGVPNETPQEPEPVDFSEFLESVPPSAPRRVAEVRVVHTRQNNTRYAEIYTPQLFLHCSSDVCNGQRYFRYTDGDKTLGMGVDTRQTFLTFTCDNCKKNKKTFALLIQVPRDDNSGLCLKFGEWPPFGPPTPARLIRMFGKDRDIFLKGRRCENQSLGIGAFTYYRRVVENQKNQILDEVIRVSQKIGASAEMLQVLEAAKSENQFSRALEMVKDAIPPALFINGHNPLTLLHSALSDGLHGKTDEQCLEFAHDARVVMVELAERLGAALKDEVELNTAVTRLMKARNA